MDGQCMIVIWQCHQVYQALLNENMDTVRDADGNVDKAVIQLALDLNKPIVFLGLRFGGRAVLPTVEV